MLAEKKEEKYTSDQFLAMYDLKGRYELIGGALYDMSPSPNIKHQRIVSKLCVTIGSYIEKHKSKCEVIAAPSDVRLSDEDVVQPDLYVVCDPKKFDEHGCVGAPDWVIEVLSPSNSQHDTVEKLSLYVKAGVREYWIVDPIFEKVLVYPIEEHRASSVGMFTFRDNIPVGICKHEEDLLTICIDNI